MAVYLYKCRDCGKTRERNRTMAQHESALVRERDPRLTPLCRSCFGVTARVFTVPNMIVRPSGWNLRPDDPGYADFNRELELGEVRGPSEEGRQYAIVDDEMPASPLIAPDHDAMRALHQMGEVMDHAIQERDDLPVFHGEGD